MYLGITLIVDRKLLIYFRESIVILLSIAVSSVLYGNVMWSINTGFLATTGTANLQSVLTSYERERPGTFIECLLMLAKPGYVICDTQ